MPAEEEEREKAAGIGILSLAFLSCSACKILSISFVSPSHKKDLASAFIA
jgi:hypothetical protein